MVDDINGDILNQKKKDEDIRKDQISWKARKEGAEKERDRITEGEDIGYGEKNVLREGIWS